jgi:hypothetical protein
MLPTMMLVHQLLWKYIFLQFENLLFEKFVDVILVQFTPTADGKNVERIVDATVSVNFNISLHFKPHFLAPAP